MPRNERVLRDTTEQSAAVMAAAGFPKMAARVLMTLMVSDQGLSATDLAQRLGVSAAAISGAVRYLQVLGLIRRTAQAGSRRDRYELPADSWYASTLDRNPLFEVLAGLAERAVGAIDDASAPGSVRSDEMARFYRFLASRMPALLQEWEEIRAPGGGG
ncbi:MAG: GbsR/MarR family transcriptional regulator [Candidatus Dormibacteraceae bacterium]